MSWALSPSVCIRATLNCPTIKLISSKGEVVPEYSAVLKSNPLPTFPESFPSRWNILLDAVLVGSQSVPVSSVVNGAPAGKAVVLLDSGTSYT